MYKYANTFLLKYLSLFLVISFWFFHNILPVFIGISIALCDIYENKFIELYNSYKIYKDNEKEKRNNIQKKVVNQNIIINDDSNIISLAETIEELGYIPSNNDRSDRNTS